MLPMEGKDLLRIALLSGVLGFAAFCLSYSLYVWRRRNAATAGPRARAMRIARVLALLGCAGIGLSWAFNEFQGRTGIAGGSGLFVVHGRRDSAARQITTVDTVAPDDVIAEFRSPADRTRLAAVEVQQAQARAKREAIQNRVLQMDEALLQEQTHLRSEFLQVKGFAFELRKSRYEIERDRTGLLTTWTREEGQLLETITSTEKELAAATSHRELTRRALQRGQELQKLNHIPQQEFDSRAVDDLMAELKVRKNRESFASLQERRRALEHRFGSSDSSFGEQITEIEKDYGKVQLTLEWLDARIGEVDRQIQMDRERAILSRAREVEAVDHDITILAAEKTRLTEVGQVRAPFAGRVVYRHPAPGLAAENAPVLAVAAGTGFTAKIRLPQHEVTELAARQEPVQLALENPVLHHFFTGRFARSEPVPFEPSRVIADLDCDLPPEVIAYLGNNAEPVRVRLLWRPSLVMQPGFQLSAALLAASILALSLGFRRRATPGAASSSGIYIDMAPSEGELRSLAALFGQQLRRQQLDPNLLARVESMLHRHRDRTEHILAEEMGRNPEIGLAAAEWMERNDDHLRDRLSAVLKVAEVVDAEAN